MKRSRAGSKSVNGVNRWVKTVSTVKPFLASRPLEVVAVDYTVLEPASDGHENVLIVTDVFTEFTQGIPHQRPAG